MSDPGAIGMPMLGFGTWQLSDDIVGMCVNEALDVGYRHVDCAYMHQNEDEIGPIFSSRVESDIFVTSKLGSEFHNVSDVRPSCRESLYSLHREKINMFLINHPVRTEMDFFPLWYSKGSLQDTWRQMVLLKEEGLAAHVGVSNFTVQKLEWLCETELVPENNQVEMHPYLPQKKLLEYCRDLKIVLSAYAPLGSYGTDFKALGHSDESPYVMEDSCLKKIATKYDTSVASILIKWGLLRGTPVIVRSHNPKHILENFRAQTLVLSKKDIEEIDALYPSHRARYFDFKHLCPTDKEVSELWDGEYF
ncbi:1,5-anhydro-D-fructose reductase [Thelohanellus kitauei]|uniref:1,5-anhydro-D-fructose reductase n=1 Tax=Thelohanellus kitauei TaxID=669202 RepID=A0A0C2ML96_THEKT|nr:1,5-anhydro-D-fructose reductase [Thelohanellus kitauei]